MTSYAVHLSDLAVLPELHPLRMLLKPFLPNETINISNKFDGVAVGEDGLNRSRRQRMIKISVILEVDEWVALIALAADEKRRLEQQAAMLIRQQLELLGLLPLGRETKDTHD